MHYQDIRPRIKSGDLIGFSHHNPASHVVQVATKSIYSHVAIAWAAAERVYVFEAVQPLVRIFPLSKLLPFYWCEINKDLNDEALNFLNSVVGDCYSVADCIRALKGDTTLDNRWQCAELGREAMRKNGHIVDCKATPRDMMGWGAGFNIPILVTE